MLWYCAGVIEAHDGWLFKHTGDGDCAAVASPNSVVAAAVDRAACHDRRINLRRGRGIGMTDTAFLPELVT